jgi:molybdate transport system substrate-binding protein
MKNIKHHLLCLVLIVFTLLLSCTKSKPESSITVFAAASTTDVVMEIARQFEKETSVKIRLSTASSGTLARQIEQGAEADVFISASKKWMDYCDSLNLLEEQQPFLKNRLVLIAHKDSVHEPFELTADSNLPSLFTSKLSMGDPAHVPAGQYALEALETLGWYEELEPRILPAADVRAALSVVEMDEADFGIVYETDALKSTKVKIISFFPQESYSPVLYYCALVQGRDSSGDAFYSYLQSNSEAAEIFTKYGFSLWD